MSEHNGAAVLAMAKVDDDELLTPAQEMWQRGGEHAHEVAQEAAHAARAPPPAPEL